MKDKRLKMLNQVIIEGIVVDCKNTLRNTEVVIENDGYKYACIIYENDFTIESGLKVRIVGKLNGSVIYVEHLETKAM